MPEQSSCTVLRAFGDSHPGLRRDNNEDRFHVDAERGVFFVIDGVGGHAAGERAAEIALSMLRSRLERETGSVADRVREAIAVANNEIYESALRDPGLTGMACVLTVAVVHDGLVTVGHVGDTRLYKVRRGSLRKITHDHSPVGDREDRGEITESEAMQHPRRNEIFRDVGSEPHSPADEGFIETVETDFEADSALLLCTDGLTDLVSAARIRDIVVRNAGAPGLVVQQLLEAANEAGGKDNVSVVFVEGPRFAGTTERCEHAAAAVDADGASTAPWFRRSPGHKAIRAAVSALAASRWSMLALGCVLGAALVLAALAWTTSVPLYVRGLLPAATWQRTWVVSQDGSGDFTSIADALGGASDGDTIRVEPGEYAESVVVNRPVALVSSVSRGAMLVPPGGLASPSTGVDLRADGARIAGFRIFGDEQRQLAVGVHVSEAGCDIDDVEVSGALTAGIEIGEASRAVVRASYVHDNPGIGVIVRARSEPSLLHNVVSNNGRRSEPAKPGIDVEATARARLFGNIVANNGVDAIGGLTSAEREEVARDNIVGLPSAQPERRATPVKARSKK
jgi:serine/threonine protein phosphatase PrpC